MVGYKRLEWFQEIGLVQNSDAHNGMIVFSLDAITIYLNPFRLPVI